jgi:hypothetical protein
MSLWLAGRVIVTWIRPAAWSYGTSRPDVLDEIAVPHARRRRVGKRGPGKERGAQDPRVSADQKGLGILRISTRQFDEASGAIPFGEFAAVPTGLPAAVAWKQPDLEEL